MVHIHYTLYGQVPSATELYVVSNFPFLTMYHCPPGCNLFNSRDQFSSPGLFAWWRHLMETFSALQAICAGNSPVPGEFPTQTPVTRVFSLICIWIKRWVNNKEAGYLRRYRAHYDVIVMAKKAIVNTSDIAWSRHHSTMAQWFSLFLTVVAIIWGHYITGRSIHIVEQHDRNVVLTR